MINIDGQDKGRERERADKEQNGRETEREKGIERVRGIEGSNGA